MIKVYKEARDNRCLIESIYPEFFFKFGDMLLNYIEILETATNNKYPYVIGGRTLYGRLQQLDKEDLIKAYLRLRNETEQLIKETENSIPKEKVKSILDKLDKKYEDRTENLESILEEQHFLFNSKDYYEGKITGLQEVKVMLIDLNKELLEKK